MIHDDVDRSTSKPLTGAVFCFTSVPPEERANYASMAESMGAIHKLDLTSDVTHLIVGNVDTAKYKYVAKQRTDVKVLPPEWIDTIRTRWMGGEDFDIEKEEIKHRLSTFYELRICLTGVEDGKGRQSISEQVMLNGAHYEGNLTKSVTHLIAARTFGAKYDRARQWGIKIVSRKWFDDSIERGMVLEESLYDPILPLEEQGKGAWVCTEPPSNYLGKRGRPSETAAEDLRTGKRKLRRTASAKLNSQNANMWGQISGAGESVQNDNGETHWQQRDGLDDGKQSRTPLEQTTGNSPLKRKIRRSSMESQPDLNEVREPREKTLSYGLFQGKNLWIFGFDLQKTNIICHHLTTRGARIHVLPISLNKIPSVVPEDGLILIPHNSSADLCAEISEKLGSLTVVSEWWLETCLEKNLLIDPREVLLSRPLSTRTVLGFNGLAICSTLFTGMELKHLAKATELMGASFHEILTTNVSVLVCRARPPPSNEKFAFALRKTIPVVSIDWFIDSIENGKKQPLESYRLDRDTSFMTSAFKEKAPSHTDQDVLPRNLDLGESALTAPSGLSRSRSERQTKGNNAGGSPAQKRLQRSPQEAAAVDETAKMGALQREMARPERADQIGPGVLKPPDQTNEEVNNHEKATNPTLDVQTPKDDFPPPTDSGGDKLGPAISELLAQRQSSRPSSASEATVRDKKKRTLGRASSGPITTSSDTLATSYSFGTKDDRDPRALDMLDAPPRMQPVLPSQALTYEDPDMQEQRAEMIKRLGGKVQEPSGNTVQPVGHVKNLVLEEEGVGKRVRKRAKMGQTRDNG